MDRSAIKILKHVNVPYWDGSGNAVILFSKEIEQFPKYDLEYAPWPDHPYKPQVKFCMAHNGGRVYIKFYVIERQIRATVTKINGPVWEDSCVEFFLAFDDLGYYNIECNCIGTVLVGFGKGKNDRQHVDPEIISRIRSKTVMMQKGGEVYWEVLLEIPVSVFTYHTITTLEGMKCRGNFYKCGDALPEPHFVSWTLIESPQPEFHLPGYFGKIDFQSV